MRRFLHLLAIAALAVFLPLTASAADNGFYLGGSIGQASFDAGSLSEEDLSGDTTGYKVFAGLRMITFVGIEGSYVDFGEVEDSPLDASASVTGYDLQAVGYLPLGIADIFVKAGMFEWEAELESLEESISNDGSDPMYGAGVQFRIKSFALRAEVEYFDIQDADELYMVSVGASITF